MLKAQNSKGTKGYTVVLSVFHADTLHMAMEVIYCPASGTPFPWFKISMYLHFQDELFSYCINDVSS